jgi:hypothetical protein
MFSLQHKKEVVGVLDFFLSFLKKYDEKSPIICFFYGVVDQRVEKDSNLDIFEMIVGTSEPTTKLINRELLIFKHYQVDVKDMKCPLQWWENMKACFLELASMLDKFQG